MDDKSSLFHEALWAAYGELQDLKEQERQITIRKAQLSITINGLYPLVFPDNGSNVASMGLPDAIRLIMSSGDRPLSAADMRTKLHDLGFDLSKFENPLANIHTAMRRMVESKELTYVEGEKKKVIAGPELKPAPTTNVLESLGLIVSPLALPEQDDRKD